MAVDLSMLRQRHIRTDIRNKAEPGVHIHWLTDPASLFAISGEWEAVLADSASDTIFLTPEWTSSWLHAYGAAHEVRALAVYRGPTLSGLALMSVRRGEQRGLPGARTLAFAADGSADSDYLDLIARCGEEETVVSAVLSAIAEAHGAWHFLRWREIPDSSPNLPLIREWITKAKWHVAEQHVPCAYVPLPSTWDAYLKDLKPRMRTKIRSALRKMSERSDVVFDRCSQEADLPERLRSLYVLHHSRWELRGRDGIFLDPAKRAFYESLSRSFLRRDWLRFYSLRVAGSYVAHQYCFERNGILYLLQEGFDKTWAEEAVGNVLRAHVFRDAINRGVRVYDFLGGVTPHKLSWGALQKQSIRLEAAPPGPYGTTFFASRRFARWGKDQVKALLRRAGLSARAD